MIMNPSMSIITKERGFFVNSGDSSLLVYKLTVRFMQKRHKCFTRKRSIELKFSGH